MEIRIGNEVFTSDDSYAICTDIYMVDGIRFIPCEGYNDFTLMVLENWKTRMKSIGYGSRETKLYFYDDSYEIRVKADANKNLTLECINTGEKRKIVEVIHCSYEEFMWALYKAYKRFHRVLYLNGLYKDRYASTYKDVLDSIEEIKQFMGYIR